MADDAGNVVVIFENGVDSFADRVSIMVVDSATI
jgi:hypothetical protein